MLAGEENVDGLESRIQVERGAGAGYPGGGHRPNSQVRILNAHSEQGKSEYVNCVLAFSSKKMQSPDECDSKPYYSTSTGYAAETISATRGYWCHAADILECLRECF